MCDKSIVKVTLYYPSKLITISINFGLTRNQPPSQSLATFTITGDSRARNFTRALLIYYEKSCQTVTAFQYGIHWTSRVLKRIASLCITANLWWPTSNNIQGSCISLKNVQSGKTDFYRKKGNCLVPFGTDFDCGSSINTGGSQNSSNTPEISVSETRKLQRNPLSVLLL